MRNIFILLIVSFANINCSQKLVTTYTKNGMEVEKINLRLLNKHFAEKYSKDSLQYYGVKQKSILVKEVRKDTLILTQASKNNGAYTSILRTFYTDEGQEYREFYINGRIKQKISMYYTEKIPVEGIGEITLSGLNGKQQYYDENGKIIEDLDFDFTYKYELEDVFEFIRWDKNDSERTYTATRYYLSSLSMNNEYINKAVEEYDKKGIHIKFDYPYWILSSRVADQYENIYLDGVTGEEIGREKRTIRHAMH